MGKKWMTVAMAVPLALLPTGCSDSAVDEEESVATDAKLCETSPSSDPCTFGQTAIYRDTVRSGEVLLEITVDKPVEFEPSDDAFILYDLPLHPVNVYFPVTIVNKSESQIDGTMLHTQATNVDQGPSDGIREVSDGDISGGAAMPPPGETRSSKEGWSMTTLDGVEFELSIDGLAGYSITFVQ